MLLCMLRNSKGVLPTGCVLKSAVTLSGASMLSWKTLCSQYKSVSIMQEGRDIGPVQDTAPLCAQDA